MEGVIVIAWIVLALVSLSYCSDIAKQKGLSVGLWSILGLAFGLFALLAISLIPARASVPEGMRAVTCPRCNADQNVPSGAPTYDCWQCHLTTAP